MLKIWLFHVAKLKNEVFSDIDVSPFRPSKQDAN